MNMYTIKTITLKNDGVERKRRIITFTDKAMAIIAEFLMTDAPIGNGVVLAQFEAVLFGNEKIATFSGNRCHVTIRGATSIVTDTFTHVDRKVQYESYTIDTKQLYNLTKNWLENKL